MAQKAAWLKGAGRVIAIDPLNYRLQKAKLVNNVETINPHDLDPVEVIREMTNGRGADVESCFKAVRRNGTVTIVGVYGTPYDNFPVHRMFDKAITIKQGQAPVLNYIDKLIELVKEEKVILNDIISHKLPLSDVSHAYDIFKNKEDDCVKVVMKP